GTGSPPLRFGGPGGLRAPVVPVAADAATGALRLPAAPDELGWWALGARPGDPAGTVLIAGHLDGPDGSPGVFAALAGLEPGARVHLTGADGHRYGYVITERRHHPADRLPAALFSGSGPPRLALVTCAGRWDPAAGRYAENLVVHGRPE
ncbi:class F sortase, partial [Streptomyces sp. YIM 98790]|uniref:class F sortase n=1 Tax=Streptomyces sp. YIM 98790 TaxID=2689077 RepID=UPI0014084C50